MIASNLCILLQGTKLYCLLSCSIIENFELIAAAFADQSVGIVITTPDIAFVAENVREKVIACVYLSL